jgi:homogentisate 1,2-dioxygenase
VEKASTAKLAPAQMKGAVAFMFESRFLMRPTAFALKNGLQKDYHACWQDIPKKFKG